METATSAGQNGSKGSKLVYNSTAFMYEIIYNDGHVSRVDEVDEDVF